MLLNERPVPASGVGGQANLPQGPLAQPPIRVGAVNPKIMESRMETKMYSAADNLPAAEHQYYAYIRRPGNGSAFQNLHFMGGV